MEVSDTTYPLSLGSNKHHLVRPDGQTHLLIASTTWRLFTGMSTEEASDYLTMRATEGFNTVMASLLHFWDEPATDAWEPEHSLYGCPFGKTTGNPYALNDPDPESLYWAHVDAVINKAEQLGIGLFLAPAWLGEEHIGWLPYINEGTVAGLAEFLATRYGNRTHVSWLLGGNHNPTADLLTVFRMMGWIFKRYAPEQLLSYHMKSGSARSCFADQTWFDFCNVTGLDPDCQSHILADYKASPPLPICLIEGDDVPFDEFSHRRACYSAILSGATGFALNNNLNPVFGVSHITHFFYGFEWDRLKPEPMESNSALVTRQGSVSVAANRPGSVLAAYAIDASFEIDLSRLSCPNLVTQWYDPTEGRYQGTESLTNDRLHRFETPGLNLDGDKDWLLLILPDLR